MADLNYDNLLIIGFGFSFHNLTTFFQRENTEMAMMNKAFEQSLIDTCSNNTLTFLEITQRLIHWEKAPYPRFCHPREEHLLPLHVCYGIYQSICSEFFEVNVLHKKSSFYLWSP